MKIRSGFVSNSSSSSFIIGKSCLNSWQIEQIKEHMAMAKVMGLHIYDIKYDEWEITETPDYIKGFTIMDNFDMLEFLEKIGVKRGDIEWEHGG